MGRRARTDSVGAWSHVFNRVQKGRQLFRGDLDRVTCLALLRQQVDLGRIVIHAYCLMGNHYHLLVESPLGQLDLAMCDFARGLAKIQNRQHGADGALFRGRYNAKRASDDRYRMDLLDYIERNPVRAGMVDSAELYPWSSAATAANPFPSSAWALSVRAQLARDAGLPLLERDALVEERMQHPGFRDAFDAVGYDDFAARWSAARRGEGEHALLARSRQWLPIAPRAAVVRVVRTLAPPEPELQNTLAVGLLRDLAAVSLADAALYLGLSTFAARCALERFELDDCRALCERLTRQLVHEVLGSGNIARRMPLARHTAGC